MKTCPRCKRRTLRTFETKKSKVELERCTKCLGVWFGGGELEKILKDLAVENLEMPFFKSKSKRECPACWELMYSFKYPGTDVQIEMCKRCSGIWLDAKELQAISRARKEASPDYDAADEYEPRGIKGVLLKFINESIDKLTDF